jgi:hypothetical protein
MRGAGRVKQELPQIIIHTGFLSSINQYPPSFQLFTKTDQLLQMTTINPLTKLDSTLTSLSSNLVSALTRSNLAQSPESRSCSKEKRTWIPSRYLLSN